MAEVKEKKEVDQRYWAYVMRQFRRKKTAVFSLYVAAFLGIVGLLSPFIANEKPLMCEYHGHVYFPAFKDILVGFGIGQFPVELQNVNWKDLHYDFVIFPPVPYLPLNQDNGNIHSIGPFAKQNVPSTLWHHWFGTDELGRDVLAGMVRGTSIAMSVGIVSMAIASIIGIIMGALAGFFGDDGFTISRVRFWFNIIFLVIGIFYGFSARSYTIADALADSMASGLFQLLISFGILGACLLFGNLLVLPLKKVPGFGTQITVPFDMIVSRIIEVLNSIPTLFLILAVISILKKPNLYVIMIIIGFTGWTSIARYIRAELLRVRSLEYIEAATSLGLSNMRILFRHAIPNSLSPVLISIAFGIASAILTESTLSFLGLGPADTVTWGLLLSYARTIPQAWWLAIFPGIAIFITVTVFNLIGEGLTDALDPRLKQ